jgi:hypothetical protein
LSVASLFIYWHVAPEDAAAAEVAARDFQAVCRMKHPGLQAHLFRRQDGDGARVTLMETYVHAAGVPGTLQADAETALTRWALSGRHVEVFEPVD